MSTIGAMGGKVSRKGGFASAKVGKDGLTGAQRAKRAGAVGGTREPTRQGNCCATYKRQGGLEA